MTTVARLPFTPRPLTVNEVRKLDVHWLHSPKCERQLHIVGLPAMALALLYEFDRAIKDYCERPCQITVDGQSVDVTYWVRPVQGADRFVLLVPNRESEPAPAGARRHHRADKLQEAARNSGLALEFVFESDVLARSAEINSYFRLLPFVQTAYRLHNQLSLREQICRIVE